MMTPAPPDPRTGLFRTEAVEAKARGASQFGSVFGLSPPWLQASYWLVVAALVGLSVVAAFGRVAEVSAGPAVISARTKHILTTRTAGLVSAVLVVPGDRVESGQVLLQLSSEQEEADRHRLEEEFERQLARSLLDRSDHSIQEALMASRSQLQAAEARLKERSLTAPSAGMVNDVRIRPGQYLETGAVVLTVVEPGDGFQVVGLLPGASRPQLARGMPLRLELAGYPYVYQTFAITEISDQVVGPAEARRFLGPDIADSVNLQGTLVLVQADVGTSFGADGHTWAFHDGMTGDARVAMRSVPVGYVVLPWLRQAFGAR